MYLHVHFQRRLDVVNWLYLRGKLTNLSILSLQIEFWKENLFRLMISTGGSRHIDICLVASRCSLHWGQYLGNNYYCENYNNYRKNNSKYL